MEEEINILTCGTWMIFTLCSVIGFLIFWFYKKPKNYLEDLGIPYIPDQPLNMLFQAMTKSYNLHEIDVERLKKYGKLYTTHELGDPVISVAHPDILRKILVKDFQNFSSRKSFPSHDIIADSMLNMINGEKWRRIRSIVSPTFSTGKIKKMTSIIIDSAKTLTNNFIANAGKPIDGKKFFNSFTMDVIASTAFGTKVCSYEDPNNRFVQKANNVFFTTFSWRMIIFFLFPKLANYLKIGIFPSKSIKFFSDETMKIINYRKSSGKTKNDFLQLLMDAEKELTEEENKTQKKNAKTYTDDKIAEELGHDGGNTKMFYGSKKYKSLSQDELIAQCVIFFLAGFDTTATTLACIFYVLAIHQEIQEQLRKEVDDTILKHDGKLTYEAIQEMKYLNNVVSETLRMYSPIVRTVRVAETDYQVEDFDITIKKGTVVSVPIYALHHDPEFYPEPERFKPERFETGEKGKRDPFSYLSFGAGPRNCVAMRFALMEIKLCIAYAISRLTVKRCSETKIPLHLSSPYPVMRPLNVKFIVEERKDKIMDNL